VIDAILPPPWLVLLVVLALIGAVLAFTLWYMPDF